MPENQKPENKTTDYGMLIGIGLFHDRASAENVYNTLLEKGYTKDDINLIMSDETRKNHFSGDMKETEIGTKAFQNAGTVGIIAAVGTSFVLPGVGIVIAGPITIGLSGAGAEGIKGGIVGALVSSGIPETRARQYESGIKDGKIVVGIQPCNDKDARYLEENLHTNKAEEIPC